LRAAMETDESDRGGLLGRASRSGKKKSTASADKGLLNKASKKSTTKKTSKSKGLLAQAKELEKPAPKSKGLLAHADEHKKPTHHHGKGLLAYADEIGVEINEEETPDVHIDLDVVSPFSSMFSSLSKKE
ncbi:hypothetical protein, partial [Treponema sp. R6D11]